MKAHTYIDLHTPPSPPLLPHTTGTSTLRRRTFRRIPAGNRRHVIKLSASAHTRRHVLLAPVLTAGAYALRSAVARADDNPPNLPAMKEPEKEKSAAEDDVVVSRIYDAAVIGEPMAVGKDKSKVWEKLMNARVVYLGEAEHVPVRDDKELELEIVKNLRKRCVESESDRSISMALEAFPCDLQEQLNQYMDKRFSFFFSL